MPNQRTRQMPWGYHHKPFLNDYRASSLSLLTNKQFQAIMEGGSRLSTLTKTKIRRMKKMDLQMELSFRGLETKGDRTMLISRLMKVVDSDGYNQEILPPPVLEPKVTYVLRVKVSSLTYSFFFIS
jgi:hypothetical protein